MTKLTIDQVKERLEQVINPIPKQQNGARLIRGKIHNIEYVDTVKDNIYMFNVDGQYILSPADAELNPIIGEFDEAPTDDIPQPFADWMDLYSEEINNFQIGASESFNLIDLGLPSGTLWADKNVGAEDIQDVGNYYAWAETDVKDKYVIANYKYTNQLLDAIQKNAEYDVAYRLDSNACIPTKEQFEELIDNCQWSIEEVDNIKLICVTGPNGNKIYFPKTGCKSESANVTYAGYIYSWTSTESSTTKAQVFKTATSGGFFVMAKRTGATIRPVSVSPKPKKRTIDPLIPYKWGQGSPWNNALPLDPSDGKRVITGCINTSMAQLIAYYGLIGVNGKLWRRSIPPTKQYTTCSGTKNAQIMPALPELYIDYNAINHYKAEDFNKTKNPDGYKMIGLLMRQLGCMNKVSYRSSVTTTSMANSLAGYKNLLHLGDSAKCIASSSGLDDFIDTIYNELEQGYPVNMAGCNSKGTGGHAFICDGYNAETNKFHFNWGWNGNYDGWFDMSLLKAGVDDFSYKKQAIVGIHPSYVTMDINNDKSVNISDIVSIVQDILDSKLYDYKKDVNYDGKIDEQDIKVLIDYIKNRL